jgi:hypothetical protein
MADFLENHQVALYLLALVAGGAASFLQSVSVLAEPLVSPHPCCTALGYLSLYPVETGCYRETSARLCIRSAGA